MVCAVKNDNMTFQNVIVGGKNAIRMHGVCLDTQPF